MAIGSSQILEGHQPTCRSDRIPVVIQHSKTGLETRLPFTVQFQLTYWVNCHVLLGNIAEDIWYKFQLTACTMELSNTKDMVRTW